jgi:hypothetical protein
MARAWAGVLSAYSGAHIEADEYRVLDGRRVLVRLHAHGRGRASGLELGGDRQSGANVFHIEDGRVTRLIVYFDREHALADLGLEE